VLGRRPPIAAHDRHILVTNTPGILTDDVADLTIGLMLASAHQASSPTATCATAPRGLKGAMPLGRSVGGETRR
jgi:lactate dehydrogenase-like 2-hydroxyacid dehydrogenase